MMGVRNTISGFSSTKSPVQCSAVQYLSNAMRKKYRCSSILVAAEDTADDTTFTAERTSPKGVWANTSSRRYLVRVLLYW